MCVAYFAAWNRERDCLRMHVSDINTEKYTHVHFAFPDLTEDFSVDVSKVQEEFDLFKQMTGIKEIVSFGGWAFSNGPNTSHIFRNAVATVESRDTLIQNMLVFVEEHDLDGLDFDWEYPGVSLIL